MTSPVLEGAEPFSHRGGRNGVLVIHGFTGSPQSMRPVADALAGAGFTVELPLLPGHGTAIEDMLPTRWSDWSGAVESAYLDLAGRCEAVAVTGLSMGGTLACWLAERHGELRGVALVNPLVTAPDQSIVDLLVSMRDEGSELAPGIGSDIAKEGVVELAYDATPVKAALSLFEAAAEVGAGLGKVEVPVLLMSSPQDHVVDPTSGDVLAERVGGPLTRVALERSFHVATLDHDGELVASKVVEFMGEVLG